MQQTFKMIANPMSLGQREPVSKFLQQQTAIPLTLPLPQRHLLSLVPPQQEQDGCSELIHSLSPQTSDDLCLGFLMETHKLRNRSIKFPTG